MNTISTVLKAHNLSVTKPRKTICAALAAHGPCSVAHLIDYCPEVDRATVYRTVDLFEKTDIIKRIWTGFKSVIELGEAFTPHHHHLICQRCQATLDLHDPELEKVLQQSAVKHGYTLQHHLVELAGECPNCQGYSAP